MPARSHQPSFCRVFPTLATPGLVMGLIASTTWAAGVAFSIDFQGPSVGLAGAFGGPINEGTILTPAPPGPPGPNPPLPGFLPPLGVILRPGAHLGIVAGQFQEVDAFSTGDDLGNVLHFSVDEFAFGIPGVPAAANVTSEGPFGAAQVSADMFRYLAPAIATGSMAPVGNKASVDGDGVAPSGPIGLGLIEPNPPTFAALPDPGDNVDAFDFNSRIKFAPPYYFSLDSRFADPLEIFPPANTATGPLNGFTGGDVLFVPVAGAAPLVYAKAGMLGLNLLGHDTDDLDALGLWDNGDMVYDPAKDRLLFSVRRNSAVIGMPDSAYGIPIEEGDVLTAPAFAGGFPAIHVTAEELGLSTVRSGFPVPTGFGDDLDALDVLTDFNDDIVIDDLDIDRLRVAIFNGSTDPHFDVNDDGVIDVADFKDQIRVVLGTETGDANLDGFVNFLDFVALSTNYGMVGTGWAQANFNLDKETNFADFAELSSNFGFVATFPLASAPVAVPEPAAVLSLALVAAGLMFTRSTGRHVTKAGLLSSHRVQGLGAPH